MAVGTEGHHKVTASNRACVGGLLGDTQRLASEGEQEEWGSGRACLLLLRESALLGNCGSDSYSVFAAAADLSC